MMDLRYLYSRGLLYGSRMSKFSPREHECNSKVSLFSCMSVQLSHLIADLHTASCLL